MEQFKTKTANEPHYNNDKRYQIAYKRMKLIKGFYIHLLIYVLVNAFIIITGFNRNGVGTSDFWTWETFSTALFWGIGLLAHGLSVFGRNLFLGANWEERKIKQFMEQDNN